MHRCRRRGNGSMGSPFGIGRRGAGLGRDQPHEIGPVLSRNSLSAGGRKQDAPNLRTAVIPTGLWRMPLGAEQAIQLIRDQRFSARRSGRAPRLDCLGCDAGDRRDNDKPANYCWQ